MTGVADSHESGSARLTGHIRVVISERPTAEGQPPALQAQAWYTVNSGAGYSDDKDDSGDSYSSWDYEGKTPFTISSMPQDWSLGDIIYMTEGLDEGALSLATAGIGDCLAFRVHGVSHTLTPPQRWDDVYGDAAPNVVLSASDGSVAERRAAAQAQVDAIVASATGPASRSAAVFALHDLLRDDPCVYSVLVRTGIQSLLDASALETASLATTGPFTGAAALGTRLAAEQSLLLWVDAMSGPPILKPCLSSASIEQAANDVTRGFTHARAIDQALTLDRKVTLTGFEGVMPEIAAEVHQMAVEAFAVARGMLPTAPRDQFLAALQEAVRLDKAATDLGHPTTSGVIEWMEAHRCEWSPCPPTDPPPPAAINVTPTARGTLIIQVNRLTLGKVSRVTDYEVRARVKGHWITLRDSRSAKPVIRTKTRLAAGHTYKVQVRAVGRNTRRKKVVSPWAPSVRVTIPKE